MLLSAEESPESDGTYNGEEKEEQKEGKLRRVFRCFHRHRLVAVAAVVLAVIILRGSWQVVANAAKNGGFFWWMDKSEEGTTMITSPEGNNEDFSNATVDQYYSITEVPEKYRRYVEETFEIEAISEYIFDFMQIRKDKHDETVAVYMRSNKDIIRFEIRIYPQEILRVREKYPGYVFEREFEDGGITFDVFSREEMTGNNTYLMYFYYGKEKYVVMGEGTESTLQDIVIEYKNVVLNDYENK